MKIWLSSGCDFVRLVGGYQRLKEHTASVFKVEVRYFLLIVISDGFFTGLKQTGRESDQSTLVLMLRMLTFISTGLSFSFADI